MTTGTAQRGIVRETTEVLMEFDVADLLPAIEEVQTTGSMTARPSFAVGGSLSATDLIVLRASWFSGNSEVVWHMIAPAGTTELKVPDLPEELAEVIPEGAGADVVTAFDMSGMSYTEILTGGYTIEEFYASCAALASGGECRFTTLDL